MKDHILEQLDENEESTHAKVAYLIIDLAACNGELLLLLRSACRAPAPAVAMGWSPGVF